MPQLLISVRSVVEARTALEAGADIIDVKEPYAGSLGAAPRQVIEDIVTAVAERAPVSMALGEWHRPTIPLTLPGITWAKVGLSRRKPNMHLHWLRLQQELLPTRLLGVVYADHQRVQAPSFVEVLRWLQQCRVQSPHPPGILIDTAIKDGRGLLQWSTVSELQRCLHQCHDAGLFLAVAGSLSMQDVHVLKETVQPDIIAVRGLVCAGAVRQARVQSDRVRSLVQYLQADSARANPLAS
jgi:(5-formylfuran-3-yl)methyl phosphate synthase